MPVLREYQKKKSSSEPFIGNRRELKSANDRCIKMGRALLGKLILLVSNIVRKARWLTHSDVMDLWNVLRVLEKIDAKLELINANRDSI